MTIVKIQSLRRTLKMVELRSKSIDLDLIYEVAKVNPIDAIQMIVLYLKLLQASSDSKDASEEK